MVTEKPIFELCPSNGPGVPNPGDVKPKAWGSYLCLGPKEAPGVEEGMNAYSKLNFTGQPGTGSALYYALTFSLPKMGWYVQKADEWIDVSPTHKEYYERTAATKQMLESTIKTGLTSAAQAVADYELMSHDLRKYKEILEYFKSKDEHILRSMFIDQVDVHTDLPGQPIAMRTIVSRWPTIIADFMRLDDSDDKPDSISKKYDISKAEAVILATKNKLFKEWKKLFKETAKERYVRIMGLVKSRQRTIEEYRDWVKPYIARFKMTRLGGERAGVRKETLRTFVDITGLSSFINQIRLFVWKPMKFAEHKKPFTEMTGKFVFNPYDKYVRDKIILNTETGLSSKDFYPWLAKKKKYCPDCKKYYPEDTKRCKNEKCGCLMLEDKCYADEIVEKEILPNWNSSNGLDPSELYYMFIDMNVIRDGTRLQVGELEDITFTNKMFVLSQNIMLVKILELWCRDRELENYIDEMLGIKFNDREIEEIAKEEFPELYGGKSPEELTEEEKKKIEREKKLQEYRNIFKIKLPSSPKFITMKSGFYERDMKDRISKHYAKYAASQLAVISAFIKAKMGVE
jgi:hypothetical protein